LPTPTKGYRAHDLDRPEDDEHYLRDDHEDQLTDSETNALEARLNQMADQIHWAHAEAFRRPG
jgi:hypothetical protein